MTKSLLLDLDGTIIDGSRDLTIAMNELLTLTGRRTLTVEELSNMVGDGAIKLTERAFSATGDPLADVKLRPMTGKFLQFYERRATTETVLYDGVKEVLITLRDEGWRLGLATNKPQAPTETIMDHFQLTPLFDALVGGDATSSRKPDPQHLFDTMAAMGLARDSFAVMVGDTSNDVNSAKRAGYKSVAVDFGFSRVKAQQLGADAVITSFHDLPKVLASFI